MDGELKSLFHPWLMAAVAAAAAIVCAAIVHRLAILALDRIYRDEPGETGGILLRHGRRPSLLVLIAFALVLVRPALDLPIEADERIGQLLSLALTAAIGWLAYSLTHSINDVVAARYDISVADNLRAREVHTRVRMLQRILGVLILAVTASVILMAIPGIRQIGITIFASAGIAGIVAGFAARPVLSNLLAGIQLALTQPIRIDDVVIVEGEWGWIEEIRMTFVVVRIWDLRRLIVPLTYFIETPFQNWTRRSADILGTVFLYADYTMPVEPLRQELHRILQAAPQWDGQVWGLQVTNAREQTMELRALMGARNSGEAWELRCHVREALIGYMQREHPQSLPRFRAELRQEAEATSATDVGNPG